MIKKKNLLIHLTKHNQPKFIRKLKKKLKIFLGIINFNNQKKHKANKLLKNK